MAPGSELSGQKYAVPTILVFHESGEALRDALANDGYFVLNARDQSEAVVIARTHSRPIHLLLTDTRAESRALAPLLQKYRPKLDVLRLGTESRETALDNILQRVRSIFQERGDGQSRESKPPVNQI